MIARLPGKLVRVPTALAAALLLVACGGGTHKAKTKTTQTTTTPAVAPKPQPLAEQVEPGVGAALSSSGSAPTGGPVLFLTRVPGLSTSRPVKVQLDFKMGPASRWTVTASADGAKSSARLTSDGGKAFKLVDLRYACTLPPTPTFCPPRRVIAQPTHYRMQFTAMPRTAIAVTANAGPVPNGPVSAGAPGSLVAPPYAVTELALAGPAAKPGSSSKSVSKPRFESVVSAKPGDQLALATRLSGDLNGAPQPVTVTLDQGPGHAITVSAEVPGGKTAVATINSASGPIALVLPRYTCYLPPAPTFCPLRKQQDSYHRYVLTFDASPKTPLIILHATTQPG